MERGVGEAERGGEGLGVGGLRTRWEGERTEDVGGVSVDSVQDDRRKTGSVARESGNRREAGTHLNGSPRRDAFLSVRPRRDFPSPGLFPSVELNSKRGVAFLGDSGIG